MLKSKGIELTETGDDGCGLGKPFTAGAQGSDADEKILIMMQQAAKDAYLAALAAGHSVLSTRDHALYEVFPGGSEKFIKEIAPPTQVVVGTFLQIE